MGISTEKPELSRLSRFSITLFVLSILQLPIYYLLLYFLPQSTQAAILAATPFVAVGIIALNIIALVSARKRHLRGKGFSIAGIVTSCLAFLIVVLFIVTVLEFIGSM